MRKLTPQQKKAFSYARDRRNDYGENDKASRKAIPSRKAQVNREYRRLLKKILNPVIEIDPDFTDSKVKNIRRRFWKKCPDTPLGVVVSRKLARRRDHAGYGKTARKRADKFAESVVIDTEEKETGNWTAWVKDLEEISAKGEDRDSAIRACKIRARVFCLEQIGAIENLKVGDDYVLCQSK